MGTNNIDSFWEVLLWSFWIFIWISAIMIWFRCVFDLFSDRTLSGWGKAGWAIVLIFVPWLGALIYLIARGRSMGERQMPPSPTRRPSRRSTSSRSRPLDQPGGADHHAKALLDSGAITQAGVRRPQGQGTRLT